MAPKKSKREDKYKWVTHINWVSTWCGIINTLCGHITVIFDFDLRDSTPICTEYTFTITCVSLAMVEGKLAIKIIFTCYAFTGSLMLTTEKELCIPLSDLT